MKTKIILLTLALLVVAPFAANAATITQTDTFSNEVLDFTQVSTFNEFDTMGGTRVLNSVTISLEFNVDSGSFIADNDSAEEADITFNYAVNAILTSSDVFISSPVGVSISDAVNLTLAADDGDGSGTITAIGPDGVEVIPSTAAISDSEVMSIPSLFEGTGTFDTSLASGRTFNITGSSGVEGGYTNMTGSGIVEVIYDYTLVPEPATLALLGFGGLLIKRRKK